MWRRKTTVGVVVQDARQLKLAVDSVDVATLRFIAADGSVLAVADVPDIPLGYGGGFLNLIPRR